MARRIELVIFTVAIGLLLNACSETPLPISHDNPDNYTLKNDVLWASPDGFDLTMDIYTPTSGKPSYPVIVMFHGGGWLINDKSIMDQASAYIVSNAEYVVCNVNYRLLSDADNTVRLNQIVNDAFGAVLWVKDNISDYAGDASNVIVTGDSAGAHLSAMVLNSGTNLSSVPFSEHSLNFTPTYLPAGRTAEHIAAEQGLTVQAAILNYGVFDVHKSALAGFESIKNPFWLMGGSIARGVFGDAHNVQDHPQMYRAVSPVYNIPEASTHSLPPTLLTSGSEDPVVTPESVRLYKQRLEAAGHTAKYWDYEGKTHAFLDSGSNRLLGSSFEHDAPPALAIMIKFLDGIFYPKEATDT